MQKAVQAVYDDGLAFRRVPARLARDFWVQPSEALVRQWCAAYCATWDFAADYQPWVVHEFSGVLCVDEVYQGALALLLAVDPAAPDGDRLVGYQLVHGPVDAASVEHFLGDLRAVGITPDQVITDGSALYPAVLAKVWPQAAPQLCLFHETRRVLRAALEVIQAVRTALPTPPAPPARRWGGPLHEQPPTEDPTDPATQHWQLRRATRQAGIAQVHALVGQGLSQRAVARQLGLNRRTVQAWLQQPRPTEVPEELAAQWRTRQLPAAETLRRQARQARWEQTQRLAAQGLSYTAIAQQVGVHRVTISNWLHRRPAVPAPDTPAASTASDAPICTQSGPEGQDESVAPAAAAGPPEPWASWDEVRQVREQLQEHRHLLLRRPDHLSAEQQAHVQALLVSPIGAALGVARQFLVDWYQLWQDEQGQRRTPGEAQTHYESWRTNVSYAAVAPLRRMQDRVTPGQFARLSVFLQQPHWEATNNGAERAGRAFRHLQRPHFNLRTVESIAGVLAVRACQRRAAARAGPAGAVPRCSRGRKRRAAARPLAA
jgi:transposase